ncbi:hypothetical protein KXW98_001391 [Aspergillus fumigatus]|uniref:Uncharacterized protein n=1 Tax=Aspergillus fumigatus TaxID=746128 RepID=A0A9P8NBM3_ASPFM|nr:hypothetical protein KXX30_007947 [Aspergillus fumigatus]KAH1344641.1 hypothetical protein KXX14_005265 [Aspergillus fumigatus]KAH1384015.1 hypothetical protein KXX50_005773 [Aspergillus fumigatus]KAH1388714.1 hypothetical protein KXX10_001407 [Aspergillus fumigatus]KAH1415358.1 hypothetical protein KXX22_006087 [Aspergillus fumigatus]
MPTTQIAPRREDQAGDSFTASTAPSPRKKSISVPPIERRVFRNIANITGGILKEPNLEETVLPVGGADWTTVMEGMQAAFPNQFPSPIDIETSQTMTLNARCTTKTADGHYLFVQAQSLPPWTGNTICQTRSREPSRETTVDSYTG